MAQSAVPNPTNHQQAIPTKIATPPDNMTHKLLQANLVGWAKDATIYRASESPAAPSITESTFHTVPFSPIIRGTTLTKDKEDVWTAMTMTFNNFYKGI